MKNHLLAAYTAGTALFATCAHTQETKTDTRPILLAPDPNILNPSMQVFGALNTLFERKCPNVSQAVLQQSFITHENESSVVTFNDLVQARDGKNDKLKQCVSDVANELNAILHPKKGTHAPCKIEIINGLRDTAPSYLLQIKCGEPKSQDEKIKKNNNGTYDA